MRACVRACVCVCVQAVKTSDEASHVVLVGEENYYLLYEVKVQALNPMGQGPNSSVVDVYSAEGS